MSTPDVSIIIRRSTKKYLPKLLEIKSQRTKLSHEVVLVDSGSTDNTITIAESYSCRILKVKREEFSFGGSLNRGCEKASGKFLVFISGHCIPKDNYWIENLVKPIAERTVDYAYGRQVEEQVLTGAKLKSSTSIFHQKHRSLNRVFIATTQIVR